jgi:hypothetical protein
VLPVGEPEALSLQLLPLPADASLQLLLNLLAFGKESGEGDLRCAREKAPSQHHLRFYLLRRWSGGADNLSGLRRRYLWHLRCLRRCNLCRCSGLLSCWL